VTSPPDVRRPWVAEVRWELGASDGTFRVVARSGAGEDGGEEVAVCESRDLRWPPERPEEVEALGAAVAELEGSLRASGWEPLAPGDAWYAKRFAWQPAPARPEEAETWPPGTEALWRCEIVWEAGYAGSRFRALARGPQGRGRRSLGASRTFRWRLMAEPDRSSPGYGDAVDALVRRLTETGWEPAGHGLEWYSARFVWPGQEAEPRLGLDRRTKT
jgi:hypothetical protein